MFTDLPNFEISGPATSDPSNPPMQKMDTVKDQMRESCHCCKESLYLCRHVWFTSSCINCKYHKYRSIFNIHFLYIHTIMMYVLFSHSLRSSWHFNMNLWSSCTHRRGRGHHRYTETILKCPTDARDKNSSDYNRTVQLQRFSIWTVLMTIYFA